MSGPSATNREIAVLARPELAGVLRLAGLSRVKSVEAGAETPESLQNVLKEWIGDDSIGVIVVDEELARLASEQIRRLRHGKRILPVVVEIPSKSREKAMDASTFYRRLSREFLGLDIELKNEEDAEATEQPRMEAE